MVCSFVVLVMHVLIHSIAMRDVHATKQQLLSTVRDYQARLRQNLLQPPEVAVFDASEFLFVSKRVANLQPHLKEAQIITNFSTPWPKHSYQRESDVSRAYTGVGRVLNESFMFFFTYFVLSVLNLPPFLHDIVVHTGLEAFFGYLLLLHVALWRIFPLLAFIPGIVLIIIFVLLVFYCRSRQLRAEEEFNQMNFASEYENINSGEGANLSYLLCQY